MKCNYQPSALPNTRIDVADVLRAVAIAGIVLIHFIEHLNFYAFPEPQSELWAAINSHVWDITFFVFSGKMYAIFALLFGLSFFIQHDNQAQRGSDFRPRFLWRMVLLMAWGILDTIFYNGDILLLYAACGVVIIPLIRASNKVLITTAIILLLQPIELGCIAVGLVNGGTALPDIGVGALFDGLFPAQAEGSLGDVMAAGIRYGIPMNFLWAIANGRFTQVIALFLIGIYLGRKRLFYNENNNLRIWKRLLVISLTLWAVFIPAEAFLPEMITVPTAQHGLGIALKMWLNFAMMTTYVSAIVIVFYTTRFGKKLSVIAPYGRMTLTHYIGQSVIGTFLFYNWGLGLYRTVGVTASLGMGAALIVLQWLFSHWWSKTHKRGPLEEIWSRLTWINK